MDIYKPKNKPNVVYKWRPGEVKEVYGPHVTIHYVGWGDEWDEVIDTTVESKRIRPAGSQLPRRSPNKNPKIDGSPSSKVTDRNNKNSTKEEELVLYKERRKSSSHVEEQRRGSFTNTYPSNGNSSQQSILRHHKVSVNGRSQRLVPESEILTESSIPPKESQKLPTNSQSLMPPKDSHPPTRELGRNLSDPGRHFSQTFSVHPESDDDNTIPPEIDESEYYETLRLETAFFEAMNRKGYHIVEMDGDGNCLFRSVAHQIYLDEDRHYELRLQCVQHLEKYADRFSSFYAGNFREYLENMKNPGVWGDDIEIKALEEMTDRPIYIYSSHSDSIAPLVTNFDEKEIMKGVQPIILSYHGKNHYNSVYDERTPLPLEKRNTQLLLNLRQKSFHK